MSFDDDLGPDIPTCEYCGNWAPCACAEQAEKPGSELTDNRLKVTFPIATEGTTPHIDEDYFDLMLQRRGLNRADWIVDHFKANEWDALRKDDRGVVRMSQTTVWFAPAVPFEDTMLGEFFEGLKSIRGGEWRALPRLKEGPPPRRILLAGDHQAPFVNEPFHEIALEALQDIRPEGIVYMGDGMDFDSLGRHTSKSPKFISSVNEGLAAVHNILTDLRDASGLTRDDWLFFLYGNHEDRLRKAINEKLPALAGLKRPLEEREILSIEFLADFDAIGFEAVTDPGGNYPYGTINLAAGTDEQPPLIATHGWLARKGAGASARASAEHLNASIAVGHTHRGAVTYFTRHNIDETFALYTAIETGTFADLQGLGYSTWPDWQPLFVIVEVDEDGGYSADAAAFDGKSLRWRDAIWTRTARGIRRS